MKQPIAVRIVSGFAALMMLVQPVMAALPNVISTRQIEEGLIASGIFENANAWEAENLASVWADYLSTFAFLADDIQDVLAMEASLSEAMREQLAVWAQLRSDLHVEGDAVTLAATVNEMDHLLRTVLDRRDSTIGDLRGQVDSIAAATAQLRRTESIDAAVISAAYEFDLSSRVLDSERDLLDRAWNALVAGQAELLDAANATEVQLEAGVTPLPMLADAFNTESASVSRWIEARTALASVFAKPLERIDHTQEATLLRASHRLAGRAAAELGNRPDANSRAHAAMAERFGRIAEQRMEQLAELAIEPVDGLYETSFLHVVDPDTLQGKWAAHARRHQTLGNALVVSLGEADRLFVQNQQTTMHTLDRARRLVGTVLKAEEAEQSEAGASLKDALFDSQAMMERYETALRQLDMTRVAILDSLTTDGKQPFNHVDLRNREEATVYAWLGVVYETAHDLILDFRMEVGALQMLAAASEGRGVDAGTASLDDVVATLDDRLSQWNTLAEAQRSGLSRLRSLSIAVTESYSRDLSGFAKHLTEIVDGHEGPYEKVLAAMQARTHHGAEVVAALTSPMLDALGGDSPRVAEPVQSWMGAASLHGTLKRMIERGHYFQAAGARDVATLTQADEKVETFATSLALVDLAMALDYPLRLFVEPEGMVIVVGHDGPGAIIRGIGNPEDFRVAPNASAVSIIPDFTAQGVLVGWDWRGAFQDFMHETGQAIRDVTSTVSQVADTVVREAQQFGAQVVEAVGPAVDMFASTAVEVGSFFWDSAIALGSSIWSDPFKLVEYGLYGSAIVGLAVATVFSKGVAAPITLPLIKKLSLSLSVKVAADYSKAMTQIAEERDYIDAQIGESARLGIDLLYMYYNIHHIARSVQNTGKVVRGVPNMLRGRTPRFTVGLTKSLRDLAKAGVITFQQARRLQYMRTAIQSYQSIYALWSVGGRAAILAESGVQDAVAISDAIYRYVQAVLFGDDFATEPVRPPTDRPDTPRPEIPAHGIGR